MSQTADITIIGAGVVGLAIANEVSKRGGDIFLIEKHETFGQEQSSRNSEVIHAGIYYDKDTLKTRLCLEGNQLLYDLCKETGIAYHECGKIIVATNAVEDEELEKLYQKSLDNGAPVVMLNRAEITELEPNLEGTSAFFSPSTGIIDTHALLRYLHGQSVRGGVQMAFKTEVTGIEKVSDGYNIRVSEPSGESEFKSRVVINSAGLYSDRIAEMAGIDIDEAGYRLKWCKGEFYSIRGGKNKLVNRLIYPVPMTISIGVHICLDVDWRMRLGPLFYYVDEHEYSIDDSKRADFNGSSMMEALPWLEPEDLEPESSCVMAMLYGKGEPMRDFVIKHEDDRGLPGFINLVGIETPGLTSSLAIGKYVSRMVDEILQV